MPLMTGSDNKIERAIKRIELAESVDKIKGLSEETLEVIATDIFENEKIEDLGNIYKLAGSKRGMKK
jgi:hypothetical protein